MVVRYLRDGEDFGSSHFAEMGNFSGSASLPASVPNTNRAQARGVAVGAQHRKQDTAVSGERGKGYDVSQRAPLAKGGKAVQVSHESYGLVNGTTPDLGDTKLEKGRNDTFMRKGPAANRVKRAMGGPAAPGPSPAAGMQPLTRTPTADPVPSGNPLARAQVTMPASDLAGLAGSAVKLGAHAAVGAISQASRSAGRGPHANPGPGIMASPAAAPLAPQQMSGVPNQGGMKTGGPVKRVKRAMGGPMVSAMPGQMPGQMPAGMPAQPMPQPMPQPGAAQPMPMQAAGPGGMGSQPRMPVQPTMAMPMPGMAKGGRLSTKARNSMPSSSFALPGKGDGAKGKGSGSYPINDEAHGRAALRMDHNASPAQRKTIESKVHAKYPNIGRGNH